MSDIPEISDASFEHQILRHDRPSVIGFWASWNDASARLEQALTELAEEFSPRVQVARIDVDDSPMISSQYELGTLPAVLLIHGEVVVTGRSGDLPRAAVRALFERAVELASEDEGDTLD